MIALYWVLLIYGAACFAIAVAVLAFTRREG